MRGAWSASAPPRAGTTTTSLANGSSGGVASRPPSSSASRSVRGRGAGERRVGPEASPGPDGTFLGPSRAHRQPAAPDRVGDGLQVAAEPADVRRAWHQWRTSTSVATGRGSTGEVEVVGGVRLVALDGPARPSTRSRRKYGASSALQPARGGAACWSVRRYAQHQHVGGAVGEHAVRVGDASDSPPSTYVRPATRAGRPASSGRHELARSAVCRAAAVGDVRRRSTPTPVRASVAIGWKPIGLARSPRSPSG